MDFNHAYIADPTKPTILIDSESFSLGLEQAQHQ